MSTDLFRSVKSPSGALSEFNPALTNTFNFTSTTRLYRLSAKGKLRSLLVQAWSLKEEISTPWTLDLVTVSPRASLNLNAMLGQQVSLQTALADGSLHSRSGIVMRATSEGSDGGFARYRLEVRPWIALLAHSRRSQVWQEQSLVQFIDSIFARCAALHKPPTSNGAGPTTSPPTLTKAPSWGPTSAVEPFAATPSNTEKPTCNSSTACSPKKASVGGLKKVRVNKARLATLPSSSPTASAPPAARKTRAAWLSARSTASAKASASTAPTAPKPAPPSKPLAANANSKPPSPPC